MKENDLSYLGTCSLFTVTYLSQVEIEPFFGMQVRKIKERILSR
jgi:hypothetical protein